MPIAYWLITVFLNVFPLPRLGGFRRSFEHAGRALDRGYSVIIFPEGHRSADGTLQPFRSGIGLLAQQAEADVLPVALVGLDQVIQQRQALVPLRAHHRPRWRPDSLRPAQHA